MANDDSSRSSSAHEERGLLDRLKTLFGLKAAPTLRDEIEDALADDAAEDAPDFSPEERTMLKNILDLRGQHVSDVMVQRPDIVAIAGDTPLAELLIKFDEAGHTRLPVYGETIDDLKGMVHIKDVLSYLTRRSRTRSKAKRLDLGKPDLDVSIVDAEVIRETLYVPPSMPASDLLAKMQANHIHMALVIDEHGGTDGLVTIENLVEMVVGDIEDEHDQIEGPMIRRGRDDTLIAQGRAPIEDLVAKLPELDLSKLADEVDTVGGLLVTLAGRVPVRGEIIAGPSEFDFEVLDADPRRVKRVRLRRRPSLPAESVEPAAKPGARDKTRAMSSSASETGAD
jgi:CBS domain containing-hemolysin-like protein